MRGSAARPSRAARLDGCPKTCPRRFHPEAIPIHRLLQNIVSRPRPAPAVWRAPAARGGPIKEEGRLQNDACHQRRLPPKKASPRRRPVPEKWLVGLDGRSTKGQLATKRRLRPKLGYPAAVLQTTRPPPPDPAGGSQTWLAPKRACSKEVSCRRFSVGGVLPKAACRRAGSRRPGLSRNPRRATRPRRDSPGGHLRRQHGLCFRALHASSIPL